MDGIVGATGRLWIMPAAAEPLDVDGKQLWYANEEGAGSVVGMDVLSWEMRTSAPRSA